MSLASRFLFPRHSLDEGKCATILKGKTILITGASYGIGEALARRLFHFEVHLILVARTKEKLELLKEESLKYKATAEFFVCDFYQEESIRDLCEHLRTHAIDILISNAGKSLNRSLEESKDRFHDFRRTMAVNYLAPVQLITNILNSLAKNRTHIVNVSTYNVLMKTPPGWTAYVSSKKAFNSWIEGNLPELQAMNITANSIYLPLVESRMKDTNVRYGNTPAMTMETAVIHLIRGMTRRNYNFKPWWHGPFQIFMLVLGPFWNFYWRRRLRKNNQSDVPR